MRRCLGWRRGRFLVLGLSRRAGTCWERTDEGEWFLEKLPELIAVQIDIVQDFIDEAGAEGFFAVDWYGRFPPVTVFEAVMASLHSHDGKAHFAEGFDHVLAGDAWELAHISMATCCMPTNSLASVESSSRHTSMASCTRVWSSSKVLAWV